MSPGPPQTAESDPRVAKLEHELELQLERINGVQEIGRALGSTLNLEKLLVLIMDKITALMGADRSTLFLLDEERGELWSRVLQGDETKEIRVGLSEGIAGWVARTGETINLKDAYKDDRFNRDVDKQTGYRTRSIVCVPIRDHRRHIIGCVQVLNRARGYFTVDDEELLSALGTQAAVSLENSKLYLSVVGKNIALAHAKSEIEARASEIDLLYQLEQEMNRQFGLDPFVRFLLQKTREAIPSRAAGLLTRRQGGWQLILSAEGLPDDPILLEQDDAGVPAEVADSGEHRILNRVPDPSAFLPALAEALGGERVRNAACVPLEIDDQRLGAILLVNRTAQSTLGFDDGDIKMLTLVAGRAEAAIVLDVRREEELNANRLAAIGQALSGVLHDLKTPMTIIGGYAQLMVDEEAAEERKDYAETIGRQLVTLKNMTGEILGFARGDSNLLLRKVFLHTWLAEHLELLRQEFAGRAEPVLELGYRDAMRVDTGKMERVIFNLARNARQAMGDDGTFRIATALDEETDEVIFELADSGPGIPEEIRHSLFESFVTLGKKGGTGLGLAIVKNIVELHGGSIDFETELGAGTTFTIRLPRDMES